MTILKIRKGIKSKLCQPSVAELAYLNVTSMNVNVKYPPAPLIGAMGDGVTDDSAAIQACDNLVKQGGKVFFPEGIYKIGAKISKSQYSTWEGIGNNNFVGNGYYTKATKILAGYDGILIEISHAPDTPTYGGRGYIENMSFWNNYLLYPNAIAIKQTGDRIQGLCFKNLDIKQFCYGIYLENASFCEFEKLYVVAKYGIRCDALSDSEFIRVETGNNIPDDKVTNISLYNFMKNGYGLRVVGITPITNGGNRFIDCRFQLASDTSYCALFENMRGLQLTNCIIDENEAVGMLIKGCENVDVVSSQGFNNGKDDSPEWTIQVENSKRVNIIGGSLYNRTVGHINSNHGNGIRVDSDCQDVKIIGTNLASTLVDKLSGFEYCKTIGVSGIITQTVALQNNWQHYDTETTLTVSKDNDTIRIIGAVKSGTLTAGTVIGTVPSWAARKTSSYSQVYVDSAASPMWVMIASNGNIEIVNDFSSNTLVAFDISFIL